MGQYISSKPKKVEEKTPEEIAISTFIDTILNDMSTNINWIPDSVERELYEKILVKMFGVLHHTLKTVEIRFMNHVITIHIEPEIKNSDS